MKAVLVHLPDVPWQCLMLDGAARLLPSFLALIESGASGLCAAVGPHPLMDGVIMTGAAPRHNGLLTRHEARPDGFGVDLASAMLLRVPAVWHYLDAAGWRSACVNMAATQCDRLEHGVIVSDAYCEIRAAHFDAWGVPPGAVLPVRMAPALADFRVHPADLEPAHIVPFLADEAAGDDGAKPRLIARILAENSTAHAAATYLLEHERPDFCAVRYPALAQLRAAFASPVGQPPGEGTAWGFLRLLDAFLARLRELAGRDAAFFITGGTAAAPFWIACGPGLAEDILWPPHTSLYQVAPSLLALFGIAAAELPGALPAGMFANGRQPPALTSMPAPHRAACSGQAASARRVLAALAAGGMPKAGPGRAQQAMLEKLRFREHFALAENARLEGRHAEASQAYAAALEIFPDDPRARAGLSRLARREARPHGAAGKAD